LEIKDRTPVLHRGKAARTGSRDHVELRKRVRHSEIVVVEREQLGRAFERETAVFFAAPLGHKGDDGRSADRADPLQVSYAQEQEVRRHFWRLPKPDIVTLVV